MVSLGMQDKGPACLNDVPSLVLTLDLDITLQLITCVAFLRKPCSTAADQTK